jgi:hypothetical protein
LKQYKRFLEAAREAEGDKEGADRAFKKVVASSKAALKASR